jgi:hypothetical protein
MADTKGYVYEHRLVVAAALGRMLRSDETVHHIDLDSLNNTPENLVVLSRSEHLSVHRFLDARDVSPIQAICLAVGMAAV